MQSPRTELSVSPIIPDLVLIPLCIAVDVPAESGVCPLVV